jgi:hypothetical protein
MSHMSAATLPLVPNPPRDQSLRPPKNLHPASGTTAVRRDAAPAFDFYDLPALSRLARPDREYLHLAGLTLPAGLVLVLAAALVITRLVSTVAPSRPPAASPEPPAAVFMYVG